MSTVSCNYTLYLEVKRLEIYHVAQKVGQTQKINILEFRNNILIFDYWKKLEIWQKVYIGPGLRETEKQYLILLSRNVKNDEV